MSTHLIAVLTWVVASTVASAARAEPLELGAAELPFAAPALLFGQPFQVGAVYGYALGSFPSASGPVELSARVTVVAMEGATLVGLDAGTARLEPALTSASGGHVDLRIDFVDALGGPVVLSALAVTVSGLADPELCQITPPQAYWLNAPTLLSVQRTNSEQFGFSTAAAVASFDDAGLIAEFARMQSLTLRVGARSGGPAALAFAFGAPRSPTFSTPVKRLSPTAYLSTEITHPTDRVRVRATFSEPVLGLTEAAFIGDNARVEPGTLRALEPTLYEFTIAVIDRPYSVTLPAGAVWGRDSALPTLAEASYGACGRGLAPHDGVCAPVCGDGVIVEPEGCDDENFQGGDGCDGLCRREMVLWLNSPTPFRRPQLSGWAVPGESVTVLVNDFQGRSTAGENGFWYYVAPLDLADGPHTVTAIAKDHDGRTASVTGELIVDTVAVLEVLTPADGSTHVAGPVLFSGIGEAGSYVWFDLFGPLRGHQSPGYFSQDFWSVSLTLPPGRYTMRAGMNDLPGNTIELSPITFEVVACEAQTDCERGVTCQPDGLCENRPPCGCDDGNPCTSDRCEGAGCVFEPVERGAPCDVGVCDGEVMPMCIGCVSDLDCGGLTCIDGDCFDLVPPPTALTEPPFNARVDGQLVVIRGSTEPGLGVTVRLVGESSSRTWNLVAGGDGRFEVTVEGLAVGPYDLFALATDAAGNRAEARSYFWVWTLSSVPRSNAGGEAPSPEDDGGCAGAGAALWGLLALGYQLGRRALMRR